MLVIRKEQMDALIEARWKAFVPIARQACRERHPEICSGMEAEQLDSVVERGVFRARSWGFETFSGLLGYLDFVLTRGADFDSVPWVADILGQTQFEPESRLDLLRWTLAEPVAGNKEPAAAYVIPDVSWPVSDPKPVPAPPALLPPGVSCMIEPPPEHWSHS